MSRRCSHKFRGVAWVVTVAFALVAIGSGPLWQCLDGTPCPPACPMLVSTVEPAGEPCDQCLELCSAPRMEAAGCAAAHCVLNPSDRQARSAPPRMSLPLFDAARNASLLKLAFVETTAPGIRPSLDFLPQRFLRPHLGRAPPVLL